MTARTQAPALGSEGWFTADPEPALLGQQCTTCGTYCSTMLERQILNRNVKP